MATMRLSFLLFCLFLASVSSVRKLNNTDDLRNTGYAKTAPRHGRQLLFWFAQKVLLDQNNKMRFDFAYGRSDYGFHWYKNREGDLPSLKSDERYYSVGNLNDRWARALPNYVRKHYNRNKPETNMDRLMVVLKQNSQNSRARVFRSYITAHNFRKMDFNSSDTYEIDPALILQIKQDCANSVVNINKTESKRCRLFLEETGYETNNCMQRRPKRSSDFLCFPNLDIELEIKTTTEGYAKIIWDNIPYDFLGKETYIEIYQNTYSSNANEDPVLKKKFKIETLFGNFNSKVKLNAGLQPQLRLYSSGIKYWLYKPHIWYGPEFDDASNVSPIRIRGYDGSLQLIAKDGKACARLYIKKTFSNWKTAFTSSSWVGFYKSSLNKNDDYYTYQYATKFAMIYSPSIEDYYIYQYNSSLTIAPGVQIRFLPKNKHVLAKTTPWEMDEESVCSEEKRLPELPSHWSYPEFFNEPEFYDAYNDVPVQIKWYDAGLQLFTREGKACARLYIKKTFKEWKKIFYYSWVGFYKTFQKINNGYSTYQYVVNFEKKDVTDNFDIYQFETSLASTPEVHIRFFMNKKYDKKGKHGEL